MTQSLGITVLSVIRTYRLNGEFFGFPILQNITPRILENVAVLSDFYSSKLPRSYPENFRQ